MTDASLPPFSCTATPQVIELLAQLDCSLVVSTYQAGKVILISSDGERLIQLPRTFDNPMGLAVDGGDMAVATRHEVVFLADDPRLAAAYPNQPGTYDALYVPRSVNYCGQLNIHDIAWGADGLVGVNTLFSCLFRLDPEYSFVPTWRPPFITELASEDRCHLNGMALVDGAPRYVTALGDTNTVQGWRENKLDAGILMDVTTNEILLRGLSMPHSPRIFDGELYLLLSATGTLVKVDLDSGRYDVINKIDAFVRGLSRHGDYLFIGCSHLRKTHTFGDLLLASAPLFCGVMVLHLPTGAIVGQIKYENSCEEIYDVQVLPGLRRPGILGTAGPIFRRALSTPDASFWGQENDKKPGQTKA